MRKFLVVMISIITVLILSFTMLYISITNSLSENSINNNVKNIIDYKNDNNSELYNEVISNVGIDQNTLNKIMSNKKINGMISEIVSSVYNYNLTGNEDYKLSEDVIVSMIEDNIDELADVSNQDITEEDKEEVLKYVRENSKELVESLYGVNIGDYR